MVKASLSGTRAKEQEVRAVAQPKFTNTWHPWAHGKVLDVLGNVCKAENLKVARKEYSLSRSGANMFGVWEIDGMQTGETRFAAGFRSSTIKEFALAFTTGARVFVCDNLMFQGTFIEIHKHFATLTIETMTNMVRKVFTQTLSGYREFSQWHEGLKKVKLSEPQSASLIVKAMKSGVLGVMKFEQFCELYESERYASTLHGFHGAMTELIRDNNLVQTQVKHKQISKFITDAYIILGSKAAH